MCPSETKAFLDSVEALCRTSGNEWYRVYLIRKIGSQYGVEFVSKLLKVDAVQWLFPGEVLLKVQRLLHHSTGLPHEGRATLKGPVSLTY